MVQGCYCGIKSFYQTIQLCGVTQVGVFFKVKAGKPICCFSMWSLCFLHPLLPPGINLTAFFPNHRHPFIYLIRVSDIHRVKVTPAVENAEGVPMSCGHFIDFHSIGIRELSKGYV